MYSPHAIILEEHTRYREALELSAELYRDLADSAGYQAGLLRRALGRDGFP